MNVVDVFEQVIAPGVANMASFATHHSAKDLTFLLVLCIDVTFEVLFRSKGLTTLNTNEWSIVAIKMFKMFPVKS